MPQKSTNEEKQLEEEIIKLKQRIGLLETIEKHYSLSKELKELREFVLYTHFFIESGLELLITASLARWEKRRPTAVDIALDLCKMGTIFSGVNFFKKMEAARELELISKENLNRFKQVNSLRNCFSHPTSHRKELRALENREKYLEALKNLGYAISLIYRAYSTIKIHK